MEHAGVTGSNGWNFCDRFFQSLDVLFQRDGAFIAEVVDPEAVAALVDVPAAGDKMVAAKVVDDVAIVVAGDGDGAVLAVSVSPCLLYEPVYIAIAAERYSRAILQD